MWLIAALGACAPGVIRTPEGSDSLRSALYTVSPSSDPEVDRSVVILANSPLDCDLPDSENPADIEAGESELVSAFTREGARVVIFEMYHLSSASWTVDFPVTTDAGTYAASGIQGAASALYWAVYESVVEDKEGLSVTYAPGDGPRDVLYVDPVDEPGEVTLTREIEEEDEDDDMVGTFRLESLDVSGRFRATRCADDADVFVLLGLRDVYSSGGIGR